MGKSGIRTYRSDDLPRLLEITRICFEGVSIDRNLDQHFGEFAPRDWKWRKDQHLIDDTTPPHDHGVFVYEIDASDIAGYITCRLDDSSRIGRIPNLAVLPEHQGQGIGKALMNHAFDYFKSKGMALAKIETLEQNPIGQSFYPNMGFEEIARQIHYAKRL